MMFAELLPREKRIDLALTVLLLLQGITLFAVIPLGATTASGRLLLDICHLAFAVIAVGVLARRRAVQMLIVAALALLVAGPGLAMKLGGDLHLGAVARHEMVALIAFTFNAAVTILVARHVFTGGRVTIHRVRGAVLLYLNVAALFAIAYGVVETVMPGSFELSARLSRDGSSSSLFSYFSLTTITTTGFGDITPVSPVARALANLEAVFGQLFPATLLARLVALHLAHEPAVVDRG